AEAAQVEDPRLHRVRVQGPGHGRRGQEMRGVRPERVGLIPRRAAPATSQMKADLRFVAIVGLTTMLLSQTSFWGILSWALSAPVHELGHCVAAWLVSRPAVPSPCKAIIFSEEPALWFLAAQLVGCGLLFKRGREEGEEMPLLVGIACAWAPLV